MSEQNTIPAEMLDAAVIAWFKRRSVTDTWINANRARRSLLWVAVEQGVQAALEAAGVPDLVAQYNEACKLLAVRVEAKRLDDAMTRIMELEAALRDRICERCDKLMANVGQLHLCGCQDQRNLCSACKAGCACAGGE